jgi:hypothetical protein
MTIVFKFYLSAGYSKGLHRLISRRAEYILDVTCAGVTTTTETNWHGVWKNSPAARAVDIAFEGLSWYPPSDTASSQHHG